MSQPMFPVQIFSRPTRGLVMQLFLTGCPSRSLRFSSKLQTPILPLLMWTLSKSQQAVLLEGFRERAGFMSSTVSSRNPWRVCSMKFESWRCPDVPPRTKRNLLRSRLWPWCPDGCLTREAVGMSWAVRHSAGSEMLGCKNMHPKIYKTQQSPH